MGKTKPWKQNTKGHVSKDQFRQVKVGSIKKNKDPKFKNTPTGKVALIDNSKARNKNVKYMPSLPSQKNAQKGFTDAKNKNKNQNSPKQAVKGNAKHLKQGSPNEKKFSSKAENKSLKRKFIFNPEETLELFDDSSSGVNEETASQEDTSLNKTDETFEDEEGSDTDTPDIFGNSLKDESDEDDEDFEEEDEVEEEDDDSDDSGNNDEEETVEYKGVKRFKGLKPKAKKNDADKEAQESDGDDDDDEGENYMNATFDESDEDDDEDNDNDDEKQVQNIKGQYDDLPMETDEDDDKDDDDDDDDDVDEEMGLKALLGQSIVDDDDDEDFNEENEDDEDVDINSEDSDDLDEENIKALLSIVDDDDDEDFNEENEDDEDDDISSEDEDDEENDNTVIQVKADKAANKKESQVEKAKKTSIIDIRTVMFKRVVIIENISKETTKEQITALFGPYGDVVQVSLDPLIILTTVTNPKTAAAKTRPKLLSFTGKLLYSNEESALNAVKAMHGKIVDGNYLMVQTLGKFNGPYDARKAVFITNLKKDVKLNEIWKAFRECGDINCVELKRNPETMSCRCGYIHFFTEEAVSNALKLSDVVEVQGQRVTVVKIRFNPNDKDWYRSETFVYRPLIGEGTERLVLHKPLKKFEHSLGESLARNATRERNVKKHKKQEDDEGKESTAFQGQKVNLKNKKKKNKLDKKKKKMAERLAAKSAKV
ncbi:uncharacterized protein LOC143907835 [Temnothorax americanus]|uniref:uncharacterized protein LOC143907835 n=1 Tax=Temnothorax americanus TaxID=1964332 RepID=UPI004067A28B